MSKFDPHLGEPYSPKAGRLFAVDFEDEYVFVSLVQEDRRWIEMVMTYELFAQFCKIMHCDELMVSKKAREDIPYFKLFVREGEFSGIWEEPYPGNPYWLKVVSLRYAAGGFN